MLWTETRLKIILALIHTESRSLNDLAHELGFKNPKNIAGHLDSLKKSGYLICDESVRSNPKYKLTRDVDAILHLYHNRHYHQILEEIRSIPWFITDLTQAYRSLSETRYAILVEMAMKSPTFFENLVVSRTPGDLRERFRLSLYPYSLIPGMRGELELILLIHQLYADAIARDMKGGRLADGFCTPLKSIRAEITELFKGRL